MQADEPVLRTEESIVDALHRSASWVPVDFEVAQECTSRNYGLLQLFLLFSQVYSVERHTWYTFATFEYTR